MKKNIERKITSLFMAAMLAVSLSVGISGKPVKAADENEQIEIDYSIFADDIEEISDEEENEKGKVGAVRGYIHSSNPVTSAYNPNVMYRDYWGDYSGNGRQDYKDLTELFGVSRKDILDTIIMNSANYYKTPFTQSYNTTTYPGRNASFNCEGFVDRVINDARMKYGLKPLNISSSCKVYPTNLSNIIAGSSNGWVDGVLAHSGISYRTYYGQTGLYETIANDGYAEPGDIIWFWCGTCPDSAIWGNGFSQAFCGFHHVAFFTGSYFSDKSLEGNLRYGATDNLSMWHSLGAMSKGGHKQMPLMYSGTANMLLNGCETKTVYATVIKWGKCVIEEPKKEPSIFLADQNKSGILAGMVVDGASPSELEYSWYASADNGNTWDTIKGWTQNDEWLLWTPQRFADYEVKCIARELNGDETYEAKTSISFHPEIKGICQIPYEGEGGGYLLGLETNDNPNNSYKYEMLILDCTLLAQGKDAWVYTTEKCLSETNCLWTIWQPEYGYYWTLFRVFDENDVMLDEACYGFVNAY